MLIHDPQADLDDKESLRLVVKDAYAVFAVTNWHEVMNKEREIQQGKNIADVAKVAIFLIYHGKITKISRNSTSNTSSGAACLMSQRVGSLLALSAQDSR